MTIATRLKMNRSSTLAVLGVVLHLGCWAFNTRRRFEVASRQEIREGGLRVVQGHLRLVEDPSRLVLVEHPKVGRKWAWWSIDLDGEMLCYIGVGNRKGTHSELIRRMESERSGGVGCTARSKRARTLTCKRHSRPLIATVYWQIGFTSGNGRSPADRRCIQEAQECLNTLTQQYPIENGGR